MALRDQPYLPLYIQDFMTDEKLIECSASATGVYIRLMCIMHKSEKYGTILLRQKFKQTDKQNTNFAMQLAKQFPYDFAVVNTALIELLEEGVLTIEGDFLIQKRMVKDAEISLLRSEAGKKGGETTKNKPPKPQGFAQAKDEAKPQANSEYEYDTEIGDENIKNVCLKILTDFGFTETRDFNKLSKISESVRFIISSGDWEYFIELYEPYLEFKRLSGQQPQGVDTFFDWPNRFEDPGWKKQNWKKLLESLNKKGSKMSETVNAFKNAPNPFANE